MSLETILLLFVFASASFLLFRASSRGIRGWTAKALLCVGVSAIGLFFKLPGLAVPVVMLWVGIVIIPNILRGYAEQQARTARPSEKTIAKAVNLAWMAAMLHPFDGWRSLPATISEVASLHEARHLIYPHNVQGPALSRPRVVTILVGLCIISYALTEILGGSTNSLVLIICGGLYPELLWRYNEWWRLLTSIFLHAGFLHLMMNMLGLVALGPVLEERYGSVRFLLSYLGAGIGSMLVLTLLGWAGLGSDGLVVGASGAIMGLVGLIAAQLMRRWWREGARNIGGQIRSVGMVVLFQVILDVLSPEISGTAHLAGLGLGFFIGLLWRQGGSGSVAGS